MNKTWFNVDLNNEEVRLILGSQLVYQKQLISFKKSMLLTNSELIIINRSLKASQDLYKTLYEFAKPELLREN